jgi:alpha-ketoglutarate-dependent taurine dioxygenase
MSTPAERISHDSITFDAFRELLDVNGYVYVDGVPDAFDHGEFLTQLGPLMPQYDGEVVWSIQAQPRFDNLYHSLNNQALRPHTECYEFDGTPPRYLALWCVVPPSDSGGTTTLADMYGFLGTLTDDERALLDRRQYQFVSSAGVQDMELGRVARHCVVTRRPDDSQLVRFSCNCVADADDFLSDIQKRVVGYFDAHHVSVKYERNALLVWDNHRMVHSRTAYEDRARLLKRVWIR